jgi:hypothetical protein
MPSRSLLPLVLLLAVLWLPACDSGGDEPPAAASGDHAAGSGAEAEALLTGAVSRLEVEAHAPGWVTAELESAPDGEASRALTAVAPGARVTVFLGTWCSDSERELARFWRALDEAGVAFEEELPFGLEYVALDRQMEEPGGRSAGRDIRFVPTFIVLRDGREVGRVVETAPHGIENDLLALLTGAVEGVVSARDDLGAEGAPGT